MQMRRKQVGHHRGSMRAAAGPAPCTGSTPGQPSALAAVAAALMGSSGHQSPKAVQALSQAFITFAMGFHPARPCWTTARCAQCCRLLPQGCLRLCGTDARRTPICKTEMPSRTDARRTDHAFHLLLLPWKWHAAALVSSAAGLLGSTGH